MKVKKAVIPAAGLGTRFLPVTKSMPKEMLPLIDIPAIHFVVKEAVDSGIDDIIIITGRGKRAVEDYFDESPELKLYLEKRKKDGLLKTMNDISSLSNLHYIRQREPKGLPDALIKAEKHVGNEPFAVLLGDDIIKSEKPCTKQLIEVYEKFQSSVIAIQKVPIKKICRYGSVKGRLIESEFKNNLYTIEDIVEKPKIEKAPSDLAAVGRYIFSSDMFDSIKNTKPGIENELQIADSIEILKQSQIIYAYEFSGKRYDIGDKLGYFQAIIDYSLTNNEIGNDAMDYIKKIANKKN